MTNASIVPGPALFAVLAVLLLAAAVVVTRGQVGSGRAVVVAGVRAAVQLAVVSLLIAVILRSGWWTAGFVALMFSVAVVTSARRIGAPRDVLWVAVAIGSGVAPVLALVLAAGVVPVRPVAVVPVAGIVIGGAMTATSQAALRSLDDLRTRYGEYEAALALGFPQRPAALEIARPAAGHALVPALDQTRTVGLVTLPGAYVGMLLGGASPVQAGATQLLVLIGLLAAQSVAVLVTVHLVAARLLHADWRRHG
ncbi:putative ABC transport system permease protein [Amycolatopsis arida]|uniref:Putative ABC transport system permease protein n=1 Tax=Amycolatopsis arida TaxID=587909 RepID=A0A1I6AGE0_9PSEU|nr:ABC transporter permease [Amycolatopsis arida]TDX97717.1 putative ABC transport system permease protein [Amycolatopsis arida]SFQ67712.1 putative ABC transport system permease protein [Amycolatopsis arida]